MKKFEKFLSMLTVYSSNLKILHWNAVGKHFLQSHSISENFYEKFSNELDRFTELAILFDEEPCDLQGAIEFLKNDNNEYIVVPTSKNYDLKDCLKSISDMSSDLYKAAMDLQASLTPDVKPELDEFLSWIRVEAFYKIGQMLKED